MGEGGGEREASIRHPTAGGADGREPPFLRSRGDQSSTDARRRTVKKFIDEVPELGGEVHWRGGGAYPRARVRGTRGAKVIISLPVSDNWSVRVGPPAGLPSEPFQRAAARLRDLGLSVGGTYATFRWREAAAEMIGGFLDEARELIRTLADGPRPAAASPHHNAVPGSARPAS